MLSSSARSSAANALKWRSRPSERSSTATSVSDVMQRGEVWSRPHDENCADLPHATHEFGTLSSRFREVSEFQI